MKYSKSEISWIKKHTPKAETEAVNDFIGKKKKGKKKKPQKSNYKKNILNKTEIFASMFVNRIGTPISYMKMWSVVCIPEDSSILGSKLRRRYFDVIWYIIDKYSYVECKDYLFAAYKSDNDVVDVDIWMSKDMAKTVLDEINDIYLIKYGKHSLSKLPVVKKESMTRPKLYLVGKESISAICDLWYNIFIPSFIEIDKTECSEKDHLPTQYRPFYNSSKKKTYSDNTKRWIIDTRNKNLSNQTMAENMLYEYLDILDIEYVPQKHIFSNGRHYFADAYIPSVNGIIEMDGGYHNTIEQKEMDRKRDNNIRSLGIKICRCNNSESNDITTFIDKINTVLGIGIPAYRYVI